MCEHEALEASLDTLFAGQSDCLAVLAALDSVRERAGASAEATSRCRARGLPNLLTRLLRSGDEQLLEAAGAVLAALASPDTRSRRCYTFGEHQLVLRDASLCDGGLGWRVWRGALSLCEELERRPALVAGRRVLELGAGCGLVGLLAARLGAASVVLTDSVPALLQCCVENAEANGLSEGVCVHCLDWTDITSSSVPTAEVALGSDVIYDSEHAAALPAVLQRHLAPGGFALLVNGIRFPDILRDFLQQLGRAGLTCVARVERSCEPQAGDDESVTLASPPLGMLYCLVWREGEEQPPALQYADGWANAASLTLDKL
jgi:predicted nicotinamide N-methyase